MSASSLRVSGGSVGSEASYHSRNRGRRRRVHNKCNVRAGFFLTSKPGIRFSRLRLFLFSRAAIPRVRQTKGGGGGFSSYLVRISIPLLDTMTDCDDQRLGKELVFVSDGLGVEDGRATVLEVGGDGGLVGGLAASGGRSWVRMVVDHGFGQGWERVVVGHGGGQGLDWMIINHGFGHGWFCFSDYGPIWEDLERGGGGGEVGWTCGMWMEHGMMVDGGKGGWSWDPGSNVASGGGTRGSSAGLPERRNMECCARHSVDQASRRDDTPARFGE